MRSTGEQALVLHVELALQRWPTDPGETVARLDPLLRSAEPIAVLSLERIYRQRRRSLVTAEGLGPVADRVEAWSRARPDGRGTGDGGAAGGLAALATMDRNGYVREIGVRALAASAESFAVPYLLLRLNDVVAPVREVAETALRRHLRAGSAPELVRALPLLESLGRRRRAAPVLGTVVGLLVRGDPAGPAALWDGARGPDPVLRDACLRALATGDPAAAVRFAVTVGDPSLRHWAAVLATAPRIDPDVQAELLPLLERDPNPRIRWRALRARSRREDAVPYLHRALVDPDSRVRYLARSRLHRSGVTVTPDHYRQALARATDSGAIVGALAGLSDMGRRSDVALVEPLLSHPNTRVRGEAWRALAAVDPGGFAARLDLLRADPSAKVRRYLPAAQT